MNKQRYLAELQRLLVFMTEEDREIIVRRYSDLFDAAGSENELTLIEQLGSPTKAAIGLSRGYEPGKLPAALPGQPASMHVTAGQPPKEAALTTEDDPFGEMPQFDLSGFVEIEEEKPETPTLELAPQPAQELPIRPVRPEPVRPAAEPEPWHKPTYEQSIPLGLGIPLFVLVIVALGLPVAAVCIAAMLILLIPGGICLFAAYLVAVGGLWCMSYMADAIVLFGAAFIVLALGIVVLWGGIWLDVKIGGAYTAGVGWLAGELLGRKVTEDA